MVYNTNFLDSGLSLKCYEFSDETKFGEGVECPEEANACLKAVAG